MGEPGIPWQGEYKRVEPHLFVPIPEKPMNIGLGGCYEPPRDILKSITGIELVEMERNRANSWCARWIVSLNLNRKAVLPPSDQWLAGCDIKTCAFRINYSNCDITLSHNSHSQRIVYRDTSSA